jgi:hypothetical protein
MSSQNKAGGAGGNASSRQQGKKKRRALPTSSTKEDEPSPKKSRRGALPASPKKMRSTHLDEKTVRRVSDWSRTKDSAPFRSLALEYVENTKEVVGRILSVWERDVAVREECALNAPVQIKKFKAHDVGQYNKIPLYELKSGTEISPVADEADLDEYDSHSTTMDFDAANEAEDDDCFITRGYVSEIFLFASAEANRPKAKVELYDTTHRVLVSVFNLKTIQGITVGQKVVALCSKRSYNGSLQLTGIMMSRLRSNVVDANDCFKLGEMKTKQAIAALPTYSPPTRTFENSVKNPKEDEYFSGVNLTCVDVCDTFVQLQCPSCDSRLKQKDEGWACNICNKVIEDDEQKVVCEPVVEFESSEGFKFEGSLKDGQCENFFKLSPDTIADGNVPDSIHFVGVSLRATVKVGLSLGRPIVSDLVRL